VAIVAGGETTGRALTIATYHILANRETVLPRLMEELHEVMPEPGTRAPLKQLENLPWLVSHQDHRGRK
jgi:cytochrome P450